MLGIARWRGRTKLACKATREMHTLTLNITTNITQNRQGVGIITKINANFLKDGFGIIFNNFRPFIS